MLLVDSIVMVAISVFSTLEVDLKHRFHSKGTWDCRKLLFSGITRSSFRSQLEFRSHLELY